MVILTRAAPTILLDPGAPAWAQRLVLRLVQVFALRLPGQPSAVLTLDKVDLPPAADWPNSVVLVADQACLGVSLGGVWRRLDLGGPV